jgi:hypothetical protein
MFRMARVDGVGLEDRGGALLDREAGSGLEQRRGDAMPPRRRVDVEAHERRDGLVVHASKPR